VLCYRCGGSSNDAVEHWWCGVLTTMTSLCNDVVVRTVRTTTLSALHDDVIIGKNTPDEFVKYLLG